MPRRLLRDGQVVEDDWQYLTELEATSASTPAGGATAIGSSAATESAQVLAAGDTNIDSSAVPALIVPFERWLTERDRWSSRAGRVGVVLQPADKVEQLGRDIARLALVAAAFPGPTDGRGYTQGRLLRERYGFTGELRAAGYVRRDQVFFLARCGFNSFELPEDQLATAATAFSTFSAEYQPSNDEGLRQKLQRR